MSDPFGPKETDEELTNKLESARHKGKDREETAMEALLTPVQQGLPTTWHSADGKTHLRGADTQVRSASGEEIRQYGFAPTRVCGTCRYFDVENARKEMHRQKFLHRLVRDETWKTKFLGVPVDHVGLCGASDGSKAVTSISKAGHCDQYRENPSFARRRRGGE
jgi:hypothetical protein